MIDLRAALASARLDFHHGLDKLDREIAALSAGQPAPSFAEDSLWQKLRDLFGLDGWHDGVWQGIATPQMIVTHIEYVANERARLLKEAIASLSPARVDGGRVNWTPFEDGAAPWSEDEQFAEAAKACKSRCKKYGYTCGQGGEEDYEYEGQCDECEHDAQEALRKKYLRSSRPTAGDDVVRLREAMAGWQNAYVAFVGAFDTPVDRRRHSNEFTEDARKRLREFNDVIVAALTQADASPPVSEVDAEGIATRLRCAEELLSRIEALIPNWRAFRDIAEAVEVTLYNLRAGR